MSALRPVTGLAPDRAPIVEAAMNKTARTLGWMTLSAAIGLGGEVVRAGSTDGDEEAIDVRVEALLRAMTLDEKVCQMTQVDLGALRGKADIARFSLGSVLSG